VGIIHAGLGKIVVIAKLRSARLGKVLHVLLEMQEPVGHDFEHAGSSPSPTRSAPESELVNPLGLRVELGMLKGQPVIQ